MNYVEIESQTENQMRHIIFKKRLITICFIFISYIFSFSSILVLYLTYYKDISFGCVFFSALWQSLPISLFILPVIYIKFEEKYSKILPAFLISYLVSVCFWLLENWTMYQLQTRNSSCDLSILIFAFFNGLFGGCAAYFYLK